tara:strand:+ start:22063 stop:23178 length:1116 start_codon:yes stop_codon:yes gene_type:complete
MKNYSRILITGANGFIAKNLIIRIKETYVNTKIECFVKGEDENSLKNKIIVSNLIIHLAGENRPKDNNDYKLNNEDLTQKICDFIGERKIPIIFSSSTQVSENTDYGKSKLKCEKILRDFSVSKNNPVNIIRMPGVFGKWCKPNYNSVVATFCSNVISSKKLKILNKNKVLELVYIDDLISHLINIMESGVTFYDIHYLENTYKITLEYLAGTIKNFSKSRENLLINKVGNGIERALYATYLSYLPKEEFIYNLTTQNDSRGSFTEILKTETSGQFSFFTAKKGKKRGGHYHHTKSEKFIVVKGKATFYFRNILTEEEHSIKVSDKKIQVIESIPGWHHDISNTGDDDLIVLLWANEIFKKEFPDTIRSKD